MQSPTLDPHRPHNLDDLLDHVDTEGGWVPSWADICRVRSYIGDAWSTGRSNAYDITSIVLHQLNDVRKERAVIEPYLSIACEAHRAAIGIPCSESSASAAAWIFNKEPSLPGTPLVCTWRVLAKHNRLDATEIFKSHLPEFSPGGHDILSISAEHPHTMQGNAKPEFQTTRVQYRHPQPLIPERFVVMGGWVIHDLRIGGKSVLAHHHDLSSDLFRNGTMGPYLSLPAIPQDQWVEIVTCPAGHGQSPWFRAAIIGTIHQEKAHMHESADTDLKKFQELREQRTLDHLAACERIRKKLELPVDALPLIDKALRDGSSSELIGNFQTAPSVTRFQSMVARLPLRLLSEQKIKRTDPITGKPTAVHVRPYTIAMRAEEIEILSKPDDWMIADVQVGARSQFPQPGPPLPGRLFTPGGTCHHFVTEPIQTGMDFTILVHYVGPEADGSIFEAVAMGSALY